MTNKASDPILVFCHICSAKPNSACTDRNTKNTLIKPHVSRGNYKLLSAWREQQTNLNGNKD